MPETTLPAPSLTEETVTRFWSLVQVRGPNECWPWLGGGWSKQPGGYGRFHIRRRGYRAHGLAFFITSGVWPMGQIVCHSCDNPPCCNPSHLFAGTQADNHQDAVAKGRKRKQPPPSHPGTSNGRAKLSEAQVRAMHKLRASGWTQAALAEHFGVCQALVSFVVRGKLWSHLSLGA